MNELKQLFLEQISAGLKRKSITTCSRWTEKYRILGGKDFPGPWKFTYHPWLKEMHDSKAELNIGQKAAQMGFTETVLNKTFFKIDIERVDCLYVLPSKTPDAGDFSSGRFNAALELSPHLTGLFSDVKNIGHKRAGSNNLYIRGSKSRSGLKSIPVGFLVLDEVDEMVQKNIPLAQERQSGQMHFESWAISTPTIENFGINELFQRSTQEHFFFKCPSCSRMIELIYPECFVSIGDELNDPNLEDSYLQCAQCKTKLPHETKYQWLSTGEWIPTYPGREARGFYIPQLYSSAKACRPSEFAKARIKANLNPADEQEFWNSKLGLPHTSEGTKINDKMITECLGSHRIGPTNSNKVVTMGVDIGTWLHYEINEWTLPLNLVSDINVESKSKVICIGKCLNFEELDLLMREYKIHYAITDALPERRKALEFAKRFCGYVSLCFYSRGIHSKNITIDKENEATIHVDRTSWLDLSLGRIKTKSISLPLDTPEEYKRHMKALVRRYEKDQDGNPIGRYIKGNEADHYAHARNYAEIALSFATGLSNSENITENII